MVFEVLGTLLGILIYTVYYLGFVHIADGDCIPGEKREGDPATRAAYRYHGLTLGILIFLFILTTFLGVREQQGKCVCVFCDYSVSENEFMFYLLYR